MQSKPFCPIISGLTIVCFLLLNDSLATAVELKYSSCSAVIKGLLPVTGGHKVYYEIHDIQDLDCPKIKSNILIKRKQNLLYFHGGWGPQSTDLNVVPLEIYRTVYFHQRGWGKSEPIGAIFNNSIEDVVEDAKLIYDNFMDHNTCADADQSSKDICENGGKDEIKIVVHGGSNGATMALLFAAKYSEIVSEVVLRGYWGMNLDHLSWDYLGAYGKRLFYPKEWETVCDIVGCSELEDSNEKYSDILMKYNEKLVGPKENVLCEDDSSSDLCKSVLYNACSFLRYDAAGSSVKTVPNDPCRWDDNSTPAWYQIHPVAAARIGIHLYLTNTDNPLPDITNLVAQKVPVNFIHGRYDMLCPPAFGHDLVKMAENKNSEIGTWKLTIVEHAAHSGNDPGMSEAIQDALREIIFR